MAQKYTLNKSRNTFKRKIKTDSQLRGIFLQSITANILSLCDSIILQENKRLPVPADIPYCDEPHSYDRVDPA